MKHNEPEYYYSLTLRGNAGHYASGDEFRGAGEPLLIGEAPDCNIRFNRPNPNFAPEYYAAIVRNDDGRSWRLIRTSPHVGIDVSGHGPVRRMTTLRNGDRISFSGQKAYLIFREHHDSAFRDNGRIIVSRPDNRLTYLLFTLLAAIVIAGAFFLSSRLRSISESDLDAYKESVFLIRVDSINCVRSIASRPDSIVWSDAYGNNSNEAGTAFLTDDGRLITARHCIEYWVGMEPDMQRGISGYAPNDLVRLIADAETWNFTHAGSDTIYRISAFCSVLDRDGKILWLFNSLDPNVEIDRSRDDFIVYDDFSSRYYWRSIRPRFMRRDMELGDAAVVRVGRRGNIVLADSATTATLGSGAETALLGFPETGNDRRIIDFVGGTYQRDMTQAGSGMIVTRVDATHGHSGAPVFIDRGGGDYVVVGILSKVDPVNSDIKYAVPAWILNNSK